MAIENVVDFDFLDRPDVSAIEAALQQLYLLDAIDKNGRIRSLGYEIVKFPLEPTYAKSLLSARSISSDCAYECAKLLSILSTENIWMSVSRSDQ